MSRPRFDSAAVIAGLLGGSGADHAGDLDTSRPAKAANPANPAGDLGTPHPAKAANPAKVQQPDDAPESALAALATLASGNAQNPAAGLDASAASWSAGSTIVDLIELCLFWHGGAFDLTDTGFSWRGRNTEPSQELADFLKARKPEIMDWLAMRDAAAGNRSRLKSAMTAEDWRAAYAERAGIRQHHCEQSPDDAELSALVDCMTLWKRDHSPAPDYSEGWPRTCWQCGQPGHDGEMSNRCCRAGVVWLHATCHGPFLADSEREAASALRALLPEAPWHAYRGQAL
jgi:hypothetical protein